MRRLRGGNLNDQPIGLVHITAAILFMTPSGRGSSGNEAVSRGRDRPVFRFADRDANDVGGIGLKSDRVTAAFNNNAILLSNHAQTTEQNCGRERRSKA